MTMTDPIRILAVSDVHFGAPDMDQEHMAHAFMETIFPLLPETDIFLINGDFYDRIVSFDNHGFDPLADVIFRLFGMCEKYGITLRVLQGTWMHDRTQCRRFQALYRNCHATFDFKLHETIDLEEITIRDRTLRFFFIPDDLPFKSSGDIVDVLTGKMREKGWDYVDYGCMHGFFDFTFPKNVSQENVIVFREEQFPFLRKAIDVGHVHQHRISGNVFSNGSFDRLVFGDEDAKGCIRFLDYPDHYTATFIHNKLAAVYDTLVFDASATTETISKTIDDHIATLPTHRTISLRFIVDSTEQFEIVRTWMREKHPGVRIARKKVTDKSDMPKMLTSSLIAKKEKKMAPTPKTLSSFVRSHMPEDYVLSIEEIETYIQS